jgi:hypothetical protein
VNQLFIQLVNIVIYQQQLRLNAKLLVRHHRLDNNLLSMFPGQISGPTTKVNLHPSTKPRALLWVHHSPSNAQDSIALMSNQELTLSTDRACLSNWADLLITKD